MRPTEEDMTDYKQRHNIDYWINETIKASTANQHVKTVARERRIEYCRTQARSIAATLRL